MVDGGLIFGTAGRDEIHIVDDAAEPYGSTSLCGLRLARQLHEIDGREHRVCQDCNERWMS